MDETPTNVVEELLRDAVGEQRKRGLPRPNEVKKYLVDAVERLDRRTEESRIRIKPKETPRSVTKERSTADMESEYQRRCGWAGITPTVGEWSVTRSPAREVKPAPSVGDVTRLDQQRRALQKRRLRARLRLLRSKPDWAAKLKSINPLALQGHLGPEKQRHAEELVKQVIRDSERVFGPWMKAPTKKLHFHG